MKRTISYHFSNVLKRIQNFRDFIVGSLAYFLVGPFLILIENIKIFLLEHKKDKIIRFIPTAYFAVGIICIF